VNHTVLIRAEQAYARLVVAHRGCARHVRHEDGCGALCTCSSEFVTALAVASRVAVVGQGTVSQASRIHRQLGRAHVNANARSEVGQERCITDCGVLV
jgi:hypothetical protein